MTQDRAETGTRYAIAASDGGLRITVRTEVTTTYRATLPEGVDVLAVEHPRRGARLLGTTGRTEESRDVIRISAPVKDGAASVGITEEISSVEAWGVAREAVGHLLAIVADGGTGIEAADRAILTRAGAITRRIEESERTLSDAQARLDALTADQDRLRRNLEAVQSDELRRRYETTLAASEDEIATLLATMQTARETQAAAERELDAVVATFG